MFSHVKRETIMLGLTWTGIVLAFIASLALGVGATAYGYDASYRNRIFPGVSAAGIRLDGQTPDQARTTLQRATQDALRDGFRFSVDGETIVLSATTISIDDPDLAQDLVRYDIESAVQTAFAQGRGKGFMRDSLDRLRLLVRPLRSPIPTEFNRPLAERSLEEIVRAKTVASRDAELRVTIATSTGAVSVAVEPERVGKSIDIGRALDTLEAQAQRLSLQPIPLQVMRVEPRITVRDLEAVKNQVPNVLSHAPFSLTAEGKRWTVSTSTLAGWLGGIRNEQDAVEVGIDPFKFGQTMNELAADLLREPRDGKLVLGEGLEVKEFIAPSAGVRIDVATSVASIYEGWKAGSSTIPLTLETITPKIEGEDAERLGIREVLGVGRSNFSGSPRNRRYNITLGAKMMSGTIVPPGEEFSQLDSLGPVDAAHGWLPELVIKGNKTTPEYGGGLCQIGTTSFRAAVASGMPITERRNHSYRVRYYEPAGFDATIYDPAPDFRFKNDTNHHILITSEIVGDNVITTVWGTSDGRVATYTKPRIWGITAPPPTKLIETLDLPPGVKKCTESAHAGANASFDYTVTTANGSSTTVTFNSYYKPWGAVCLIGVEALSAPVEGVDMTGVNNPQI